MNNIVLSGRVVKEIEPRLTTTNKQVISNTIAVRRDKEKTDFINFIAWEHNAEFINRYVKKGDRILINGELQQRVYEKGDKKEYVYEVLVRNIELLEPKQEEKEQENLEESNKQVFDISDDDLPF